MPAKDPNQYAAEEAAREFYPGFRADEISLYYVSYLRPGSTEPDMDYLWLPNNERLRDELIDDQYRDSTILDVGLDSDAI